MASLTEMLSFVGVRPSGIRFYYEFNTNSGVFIPSVLSGQSNYSGLLSSTGNFYRIAGSGYFTGQSITVQNSTTGLNNNAFTHLFLIEKSGVSDGIIFSNYVTGLTNDGCAANLGYAIGVNAANRAYFEYSNRGNPTTEIFNYPIGNRSVMAVSRYNNKITFSTYDYVAEKLISQSNTINSDCLFDSTQWYIGKAVNPPSYFNPFPYSGHMDWYMYINQSLDPTSLRYLFSGSDIGGGTSGSNPSNAVDTITYLRNIDSGDVSALITHTGRSLAYNKVSNFNSTNGTFKLDGFYNLNQLNIYVNGQALWASGSALTGCACNTGLYLSGDYAIIRDGINSTGFYDVNDLLIYDKITSDRVIVTGFQHGPNSGQRIVNGDSNHLWFLNGMLLNSGLTGYITGANNVAHYFPQVGSISFPSGALFNGASGVLFSAPITGYQRISGIFSSITVAPFSQGTSMLFMNGQRQRLGIDYIESSSSSLTNGSGVADSSLTTIYNNTNQFFELI